MQSRLVMMVAGLLLVGAFQANAATITVFNGISAGGLRADWEAAVATFSEENFSDNTWQDATVSFLGGGHTPDCCPGPEISGGELHDRLEPGNSTQFTFGTPINAFGANWDLSPGGVVMGISISAGGELVPIQIATHTGQFFGFISDTPFSTITLTSGTQAACCAEQFDLDNAVYATAAPAPEPTSLLLFGTGALGVLARMRRRKQQ